MLDQAKKTAADLARRIRLSVTKAIIESVFDSTAIQTVKLAGLSGEVFGNVERLQSYGLTSNPPAGSEALLVEVGGSRDNPIVIIIESSANRPKNLVSGEVAFWSRFAQAITHKANGNTEYTATIHKLNGGGRDAARKDDAIESITTDDAVFWAWISAVGAALGPSGLALVTAPIPTSLAGKITEGTSEVELP